MRGPFITFEGGEGSGKTTQIAKTYDYLVNAKDLCVLKTRDPGGTPICDGIRAVLLDARNKAMDPMVELLLYLASRRQLTQELILPMMEKGIWVLCDRYHDSTWAYQVYSRLGEYEGPVPGFPTVRNYRYIEEIIQSGIEPDLTIWLDLPVERGLDRAMARASALPTDQREDRFEQKHLDFHRKLRESYTKRHHECGNRIRRVIGNGTVEQTWELVKAELDYFMEKWMVRGV